MYITQVLSIIFPVNVKYLELQYSIDGILTFSRKNTASIYLPLAKTVYLQIIMVEFQFEIYIFLLSSVVNAVPVADLFVNI